MSKEKGYIQSLDHGASKVLSQELLKDAITEYPDFEWFISRLYHNAYRYIQYRRLIEGVKFKCFIEGLEKAKQQKELFWDDETVIINKDDKELEDKQVERALKKIMEASTQQSEPEDTELECNECSNPVFKDNKCSYHYKGDF